MGVATTIVGAPAAVAGIMVSRYTRANNIEFNEYVIGAIAVLFAFFIVL
ncbi:MAG: hypothetical protein IJZ35_00850 [Clostridia bacterium]|nr:hypothetical protein [Clostridia bacterium]